MSYTNDIRKDGEIRRLKTKCKHASEVLGQIDGAIRDWNLTLDEQKKELRDWVYSLKEYLNKEKD